MTSTADTTSDNTGHPLLHAAYRPFFLAATIQGAVIMLFWLIDYLSGYPMASLYGQKQWHAHEMLHGFALAFVAGYLLHAVGNWTGIEPLGRRTLLGLVLLWLGGRFLPFFPDLIPPSLAAMPDLLFPLLLTAIVAATLIETRSSHAYAVIEVLLFTSVVAIVNYWQAVGWFATRVTTDGTMLLTLIALLAVLAGKLIPGFTERTLGLEMRPARHAALIENTAIGTIYALVLMIPFVGPTHWLSAVTALIAAITNGLRLRSWYLPEIWREPSLWVLYCGYGWIVLGLLMLAAGAIGITTPEAGWHGLGVGGIGLFAAGLMTRVVDANRSRTPQPPPDSWIVTGYVLLNVAAGALAVLPWLIDTLTLRWHIVAGVGWILALTLLAWRFFEPLATAQDS